MFIAKREKAILDQAKENRAIDSIHAHMWAGVTTHHTQQLQPHPDGMKILCLDGGGVKGLFSALVLEEIMEAVRRIDTPNSPDALKPCNYFDLICGTSTGGLLAIMLGRLRMDVHSCGRAYRGLARDIFQKTVWTVPGKKWWDAYRDKPWFSGQKLESATKNLLEDYISKEEKQDLYKEGIAPGDAPLRYMKSQNGSNTCRTFVCALPEGVRQCHRFRTYMPASNLSGTDCTIWEAARATSAAPLYFPPMKIGGCAYFDGGMESNNPILEAVREAGQEFPKDQLTTAIVSIGCGSSAPSSPGGGLLSLIKSAVERVTDTEAKHNEFLEQFPGLRNIYFRLQETDRLGMIDLAAWERLDEIERLAKIFIGSEQGQADIRRCAEKLARSTVARE